MEMNLPLREILIGVVSILVFYGLQKLVGLLRHRGDSASVAEVTEAPSKSEEVRIESMQRNLVELNKRVSQLEAKLQEAPPPVSKPDVAAYPDQPVYATATMLARDGLSAAELSERCGISFSEAELIVALNRQKGSAGQASRQLS